MIVDVHYHLLVEDWLPEAWWQSICQVYHNVLKAMGMAMAMEEIRRNILDTFWDPDGEKLIAEMNESGIDKTVILPQDFEMPMGKPRASIEDQNRSFAELQKRHPDRIIAFAGVDPTRPGAIELIEKCIKQWGLKGIKIHPGSGFFPDQGDAYNLLAKANDLGVPILTHCGVWLGKSKYCDPIYLDDVLLDFPHMVIIAAHLGRGWQNVLFEMGAHRPNLATDFSGWQLAAQQHYHLFCQNLRFALDAFGPGRVLFGTDGPFYRPAMSNKDFINIVRSLPENAPQGINFSETEVEGMLGANAAAMLGLSS